ncbi:MAG: histidine kinase [Bryobacteraceae bacterium]
MPEPGRGRLKILLGYAAGVGKTYRMLDEAQELRREGVDVAIGYFEPHARKDTIGKTEGLEIVPRRKVEYRGSTFEEMDADAILARHPQVCVVDEFAHTNVPGSARLKRWEDVEVLLDAGIDVLTTMNVQHLESLNDHIWQVTGIRVRETIPDWVMKQAGEVVLVDLTPQALLNRLQRGVVYPPDKVERALQNFFKESTLVALRELALRQTAHEVDVRQPEDSAAAPVVSERLPPATANRPAEVCDRLLIYITADPSSAALIRRGKRVADYLKAECFAVSVARQPEFRGIPAPAREAIERHLNFARNLHIEARVLQGADVAKTLVDFARLNQVTQIFLARPRRGFLPLAPDFVLQVVRLARDIQVTIVAERHGSNKK